jgi:hypothetical protein
VAVVYVMLTINQSQESGSAVGCLDVWYVKVAVKPTKISDTTPSFLRQRYTFDKDTTSHYIQ